MPSNGICRGFAFKYGKFLLPPRFLTALSVPKVPTREQLLSLSHISIKIAFSYSCHDADTIFPVSFIFTASSFRTPCLFLLDRNGPIVSFRSRRTIYIQTKPPECSSLFYIIPTRSLRLSHKKTIFCNENSNFINFPYYFQLCHRLYPLLQISSVIYLIRLLEHNLPEQIFSHTFLFKPHLYEKERLHILRVPYTVFLYPPFVIALFQRLPRRRSRFSRILLSRPLCLMNPDQVTLILIGKVEGNHILQLAAQLAYRTFSRFHLFLQFA